MRKKNHLSQTSSRKKDHVLLTVKQDVTFREKKTGFDEWEFVHNALPEINLSQIKAETTFLGKSVSMPLLISSMTGGYADATRINRILAEVCESEQLAMGVGSQRQALEDSTFHSSFTIVRKVAPTIPAIGNIGAAEIANCIDPAPIIRLAEMIRADAFAIHLNPLQEFLQPEGNTNFAGVLQGIERLVKRIAIPVIVKEIGAGISKSVAQRLLDVGVTLIDVAGAGGTSWAGVEILRKKKNHDTEHWNQFWDWGIPTCEALLSVAELRKTHPSLKIIASGGITTGFNSAKAFALGADIVGSARPMMKAVFAGGKKSLLELIECWRRELTGVMFLTGAATIEDLKKVKMIMRSRVPAGEIYHH